MLQQKPLFRFALYFFSFAYIIPLVFTIGGMLVDDTIETVFELFFTFNKTLFFLFQFGGLLFISYYFDDNAKKYIIEKKQSFIIGNIFILFCWFTPLFAGIVIFNREIDSEAYSLVIFVLIYNTILNLIIGGLYGRHVENIRRFASR